LRSSAIHEFYSTSHADIAVYSNESASANLVRDWQCP
jgi:hypothetical protein